MLAAAGLCALPASAAQIPGFGLGDHPEFTGRPAKARPVKAPDVPRHPFMARNGRSVIHNDAYQTDTYTLSGPLGRDIATTTTLQAAECGSITFDRRGRIITVCVGVQGPRLMMLDPRTLEPMANFALPLRQFRGLNPAGLFSDFSGGGYFYLDNRDRAVLPTTNRHIIVVAQSGNGFKKVADYRLGDAVRRGEGVTSVLPDWSGRLWFVGKEGSIGFVDPRTGHIESIRTGEPVGNSFAVGDDGGVFVVTDAAMYRFDVSRAGKPRVTWRETYDNIGETKPGQTEAGSGTTPTLMGGRWVAITDNADPMKIVVYKRGRNVRGSRVVCEQPVFSKGASSTDQSLIGAGRAMVVENNYGYAGIASTLGGKTTEPGIERVDIDRDGRGCDPVWHNDARAPSVVPKLSLANGLVYTYTKDPGDASDPWYFTAIDFHTGKTVWRRLAGLSFGFNNNFAPVSIGPDGTAYVGVIGGLVSFRDTR